MTDSMTTQERAIREQDIRDFEWACSLNPKSHRSLRMLSSDHQVATVYQRDELEDIQRQSRLKDRRKGIEPMIG